MLILCIFVVFINTCQTTVLSHVQEAPSERRQTPLFKADMKDVHFMLWTRNNPGHSEGYELLLHDAQNLRESPFNASRPTNMIVHGWHSNTDTKWPAKATTQLLQYHDCNVIAIDWSKIAHHLNYYGVVENVPLVGNHSAQFLDFLHDEGGLDITTLYVTGHSLGAHVAGIMGYLVRNGPIGRITGLDPAGPEFHSVSLDQRLDKSDAKFVDVIHTNSGGLLHFCVGLADKMGHVDYYPNGGAHQPGCTYGGAWTDLLRAGCSHERSHKYWLESINGRLPFTSRPCPSWRDYKHMRCGDCGQGCLNMGFHGYTELRGTYFLETSSKTPYALGDTGV